MKVFLADQVSPDCARILRDAGLEVDDRPGLPDAEKLAALADAEGLVVRSATTVTAEMIAAAPKLRVIGRAGSGVDNIDVAAATGHGVLVMNAPGENTLSAAEHALAMLLALCRNIPAADARMRTGAWDKKGLMGVELYGKACGVIGLGRIGRDVASRAKAFGMRILGFDPFLPPEVADSLGIELLEIEEILPQADFLTLHAPLTDRTRHILGTDALARCKAGVRIVNCARGGVVDDDALVAALDSGRVAGAALDVFENEPLPAEHALRSHPKVVLTPHLGASTTEAQEKVAVRIAEQIAAYLTDGAVRNAVNSFSVEAGMAVRLNPFLRLAESLGRLHARLVDGHPEEISIQIAGDASDLPAEAVSAAVLMGFLEPLLSQKVNLVNAQGVAREHGYRVVESRTQGEGPYTSLLTVKVSTGNGVRRIAGTVFGKDKPKIVRIDDYYLEMATRGNLLLYQNDDKPGRLAAVTAVLARNGVNIADAALGRDRDSGRALSALALDVELDPAVVDEVRAAEGVVWAEFALPWILDAVREWLPQPGSVLDLFSGTSRVGHALKADGWRVLANDHNAYAATLARCYVQADAQDWAEQVALLVREANAVAMAAAPEGTTDEQVRGDWFTEDYCRRSRFFRPVNGVRIEAVRRWIAAQHADPELEAVLLVALMEAADRVDSTTGVQMAYLKQWAPRAHRPLQLRVPALVPRAAAGRGEAWQLDAAVAAARAEVDLAYLDPPYNQHKYLGNYHVWESLVLWDAPEVYGVACKRVDCRVRRSGFNSRPGFRAAFEEVVDALRCPRLLVSFSDEGFLPRAEMEALLARRGTVRVLQAGHDRYVGARIGIHNPAGEKVGKVSHTRNREFLFLVERA